MVDKISSSVREGMNESISEKEIVPIDVLLFKELEGSGVKEDTLTEIRTIINDLPLGYGKARSILSTDGEEKSWRWGPFYHICK